jgi:hypothetical protein
MVTISVARKVLPGGHLHSDVHDLTEHDPIVTAWLQNFVAMQMIDVLVPTTDGRELLLTHHTRSEPELRLCSTSSGSNCWPSRRRKLPARRLGLDPRRSEDLSGRAPAKSIT